MSPADSNLIAQSVSAQNAKRTKRAEAAAHVVLFVVFTILGAVALVHFLTPCEVGHLCALAAAPVRAGFAASLVSRLRAAYLRQRIAWAEDDLEAIGAELASRNN